jgi:Bifunctional DNA primase/polymerase, N-terminal/AAA domain
MRSALHEAARQWAEAGFYVAPARAHSKKPAIEAWEKHASTDLNQIDRWWTENPDYNIIVVPARSNMFVLDQDGPDGAATLARLVKDHCALPDTLTIRTPSGPSNLHFWYLGECPNSVGTLGEKVDTRGLTQPEKYGYVLVPPSYVVDPDKGIDGSYEYASDTDEIVSGPQWIADALLARRESVAKAAEGVELDTPSNIARATQMLRDYVEHGHVAIEGEGGDNRTYAVAAETLNHGLTPAKAFELLRDEFNPHCVPPWQEDDLAAKVANALEYAQNEQGAWAVPDSATLFAHFADPQSKAIGPVSFGDVLTREVAPVQELIPGLVEKGTVTFLSAPGGSHKSRLAVQWGLSIDAGKPIFGRAVERSRFVYVSYEDHADEVARRAQAIARRLTLAPNSAGQFWDLSGKDAPLAIVQESGECETRPFWDALREHLTGDAGHKFVVIDSTYNALRFAGAAKINEGAVMAGIGLLQRLCDECDCTLLVLWHPSQAGQERGDASGWSVAWHNAPRARLSITPVKDVEDAYDLKVEKRNHGAKGKPITLHWSDGVLLPRTETATSEQAAQLHAAVVRVATDAAEAGAPIQQQRRLLKWQLDEIERAIGRRPSEREVKEELAASLPRGDLRYVKGTQRRTAGFYPPDQDKAEELARVAKRQAGDGGDDV